MSDDNLRALERAAKSKAESDCLRYWAEAIRHGLAATIRPDVAAAVEVDRQAWAVPVLSQLRALAGEKPLKVGDWVRVKNRKIATHGCYGRVRFPTTTQGRGRGHMVTVEIRSTLGLLPRIYLPSSVELTVDPGPEGVIYTVAADVKQERRKRPLPKDDEERASAFDRLALDLAAEATSPRGRFGRNRA